jgi:putative FmdB family regulatory protein
MPFYEYECSSCRYYSEVLQKITDKALKKCPSCGKSTFKKLISAPVFRLKGSGWYETDFKTDKDNKRNLAGGDKEDASAKSESGTESKTETAAAGAEGKTESKTESKTETKAEGKTDSKADAKAAAGKSAGKADTAASSPAPKRPPAVTTRNVARRAAPGKSAASRHARPAKRKAGKRRGGR